MVRKHHLDRAETFTFVKPWIQYFLFFFSFLFWVFYLLIVAIGAYPKVQKATANTVREAFLIDPAAILIPVGVVMFFITFCECIGALRENIDLLKIFSSSLTLVFLLIAILAFFYSEQAHHPLGWVVKKGIKHYKDDLDLQNMMDSIQKKVMSFAQFQCCGWNNYRDRSRNTYFNCTEENPSSDRNAVLFSCCAFLPIEVDKSIYPVGCADRATFWIKSHLLLVGSLALGLALPQIAGIVLSQILISQIREEITSLS